MVRPHEFDNAVTGGRVPREYIPSVDAGAQDAMRTAFSPATRWSTLKVTLLDGQYHDVDSSEMAFKIAGAQALKEAARILTRSSWSRSWPLRSRLRRTTWVM